MFFLVDCQQPGFKLVDCAHFVALDGTRTLACHFRDAFVPDAMVLSHPGQSAAYVRRIKPGMILAQMGMGLGLIEACVDMMKQSNKTHAHVNQYLDDQVGDIEAALQEARAASYALADTLSADPQADVVLDILKLRLAGGEYAVKAAHAAMLHMGARGLPAKEPGAAAPARVLFHRHCDACDQASAARDRAHRGRRRGLRGSLRLTSVDLHRFAVHMSAAEAIERLVSAAAAVPMGLVAQINGQANCAKKGIEVAPDQILEIFRPDFAVKVWAADKARRVRHSDPHPRLRA